MVDADASRREQIQRERMEGRKKMSRGDRETRKMREEDAFQLERGECERSGKREEIKKEEETSVVVQSGALIGLLKLKGWSRGALSRRCAHVRSSERERGVQRGRGDKG